MKHYKPLKDFVSKNGFLVEAHRIEGVNYDEDDPFTKSLIQYGFIEEIPERPKTVWDLKIGDAYYIPDWDDQVGFDTWLDRPKDLMRRTLGNCFLTKEEAEKELARRKAEVVLKRDTKGFKPNYEQQGVCVYWHHDGKRLEFSDCIYLDGTIRFATHEDAETSIKAHPDEWKTYLGVEE